jgi:hypothetical protein
MEKQQSDISTNISCSCKANYYCSYVALTSDCTTCKQFLGSTCLFTKTKLVNNKIIMHKCMFQKEEENSKYSRLLKTLLYTDSVKLYKFLEPLLEHPNKSQTFPHLHDRPHFTRLTSRKPQPRPRSANQPHELIQEQYIKMSSTLNYEPVIQRNFKGSPLH